MKYIIKCDDCKKTIGETDSLAESAAGGICNDCKPERNYLEEAYSIAWGESKLLPERAHIQAIIDHNNDTLIRLETVIREG